MNKMVKAENGIKPISATSSEEASTSKSKQKNQGKKRKRYSSNSSNDDNIILPDNALETERNVHASALKNNLDETSVRKIIKRVVTNDHVLAFVQLREEEEDSSTDDKKLQPKLTRAKVKELKKVSHKSAPWNLENLELTPIKHIHVKTRPEVTALIAQELPEDEDDEEYEPTHDDVPSDDDHAESCSDLDSQPRTPATPARLQPDSPQVVKDGPFKVPQEISTVRRKLEIEEEEATIALRTRSKLSLSSTSIEHIESTFIPPDDLPVQDVDEVWNQFLNECLNPASTSKHEDDDEADPEYNVAADPDAHDEDEESLGKSLIKISKKELNDLVTELFSILPESAEAELVENLANSVPLSNSVLTDTSQVEISKWEGKQEPISDDESKDPPSKRLTFEKKEYSRVNLGKNEREHQNMVIAGGKEIVDAQSEKENVENRKVNVIQQKELLPPPRLNITDKTIQISIEEANTTEASTAQQAPASLLSRIKPAVAQTVHIKVDSTVTMTPEQLQILQQQLRQHVQLSTSNFMQTVVHPVHWKLAPTFKGYLASLTELAEKKKDSVANVCNLKPAFELVTTWEKSVSGDTPENRAMIEFIQGEVERSRRRTAQNNLYVGEFHETFKKVVCNSTVFLYPYLLPAMPFRPDVLRRFSYLHSEDVLIVLGLDQFWRYVENNPTLFKLNQGSHPRARRGLNASIQLVCKHLLPWMTPRLLAGHIHSARTQADKNNPIHRYFKHNEVPEVTHRLLPYNPSITLYEQPEHEVPKIWVRYLAKSSRRFRGHLHKRLNAIGRQPDGVIINPGIPLDTSIKKPLPIDFTKEIVCNRPAKPVEPKLTDRFDINIQRLDNQEGNTQGNVNKDTSTADSSPMPNFFRLVHTNAGALLIPLKVSTQTVNSSQSSITTPAEVSSVSHNLHLTPKTAIYQNEHCMCCVMLKKICKMKQMCITDYFSSQSVKKCACSSVKYPKISNRLKLLVRNHKKGSELVFMELERKLGSAERNNETEMQDCDSKDMIHALTYQHKVFSQASMSRRQNVKQRFTNLLTKFDEESSNPTALAADLFNSFGVELVDLYLDFLGFLTPEQADKMDVFRDYFTRNCAKDLMEKVEEQVSNKEARHKILTQLKSTFSGAKSSSCEMCSGLLQTMEGYPSLARYTFGLFPHRKETRPQLYTTLVNGTVPLTSVEEQRDANDTMQVEPNQTVDYEADHSSCGEDSDSMSVDVETPPVEANQDHQDGVAAIKIEPSTDDQEEASEIISKNKTEEYDSDTSMSIFEADNVKLEEETSEWSRDEDKLVLQVLKEHLTPEERKLQTTLEILEEKNLFGILSESLIDRSISQIKERVVFILSNA